MTDPQVDPLIVRPGEHGIVRVFALDLPDEQARFLREDGAAAQMLGTGPLDPAHVDVIQLRDLEEFGLTGYLAEGLGIPEADLARDRPQLDALTDWVLVVRSNAFESTGTSIVPVDGVRLVATLGEPETDWTATPIRADSARLYSGAKTPPRTIRAEARRIGFIWFACVMSLIIGGLLWLVL